MELSTYHKGKITEKYRLDEELGRYLIYFFPVIILKSTYRGSFAIVKNAVNKKTGDKVAIKIIDKYTYPTLNALLTFLFI